MTRLASFVSPAILDDEPDVHFLSISLAVPLKRLAAVFQHETAGPSTFYSLTTDEMQNCQWLEPCLVAQIEFTEWTP